MVKYGIVPEKFTKYDLHIHIPEGATPKDGPSAGITLSTAIMSVMTGRKVDENVAMTGEVTLTGRVLAIGRLEGKVAGGIQKRNKDAHYSERERQGYRRITGGS